MAFDFAEAKRRFRSSRKLHPALVEGLIRDHEEALGLLRDTPLRGATGFDFAEAKRRFESSRKLHPTLVEGLIRDHEEALGLLRDRVFPEISRSGICPICGPLADRGTHARGCRLARLLGSL
ncbi:MAG TPA: hypothetical protein VMK42_19935 [Anaeromyxobacteraceae bacterium]|nr:hypothetical protein [Anaeromyxobacteraceae bacterium]